MKDFSISYPEKLNWLVVPIEEGSFDVPIEFIEEKSFDILTDQLVQSVIDSLLESSGEKEGIIYHL